MYKVPISILIIKSIVQNAVTYISTDIKIIVKEEKISHTGCELTTVLWKEIIQLVINNNS